MQHVQRPEATIIPGQRHIRPPWAPSSTAAFGTGKAANQGSTIPAPQLHHLPGSSSVLTNDYDSPRSNGSPTITYALTVSCNTAFAKLGDTFGGSALHNYANLFGFNNPALTIPLAVSPSSYPLPTDPAQTALSAIGQFNDTVTPLQEAMIAAAIANGGTLMRPYLVQQVKAPDGSIVSADHPVVLRHVITARVASYLTQMMENITHNPNGTAYQVAGPPATSILIAGATGTAQNGVNNSNLDDAVFTCFAPARNPKIAVAVIGVSAVTTAKAYRLLKAIFATAEDDGSIRRNPCRIKGAGQEKSPERPTLTIPQVFTLAEAIGQRYQALVLLAMFSSLRWGELAGLRRCDIDLEARTVRVDRQLTEVRGRGIEFGPPKSAAGNRVVPIPEVIISVIRWHLSCFALPGDEGPVFTSPTGQPLRHSHFRQRAWLKALSAAGLADFHFHDLRHSGNTLAANAGASLRELMDRMGHDSERAAMIYLHGSDARQHQIADSLSKLARAELKRASTRKDTHAPGQSSGTQRARSRKNAS